MSDCGYSNKEKTTKILNTLFNPDLNNNETILLVRNDSDCNIIMNIQGPKIYRIAVLAHGENTVVVEKGPYQLKSDVCNADYSSDKILDKHLMVVLQHNTSSTTANNAGSPLKNVNSQK